MSDGMLRIIQELASYVVAVMSQQVAAKKIHCAMMMAMFFVMNVIHQSRLIRAIPKVIYVCWPQQKQLYGAQKATEMESQVGFLSRTGSEIEACQEKSPRQETRSKIKSLNLRSAIL